VSRNEHQAAAMSVTGADRVSQLIRSGDKAVWSAAALAIGLRGVGADEHRRAATRKSGEHMFP